MRKFKLCISFIFAIFLIQIVAFANPTATTIVKNANMIYGEAIGFYDESQFEGTLLSETPKISENIHEYIARELRNMSEIIDLTSYNFTKNKLQEFRDVYGNTLRMNADLYYVAFNYRYGYNSEGKITSVLPNYIVTDKNEKKYGRLQKQTIKLDDEDVIYDFVTEEDGFEKACNVAI